MANFPLAEATVETHGLRDQVGRRRHRSYSRSTRAQIAQTWILDRAAPVLGVPYRRRGPRPVWGRIYGRAVPGALAFGGQPASLPRFQRNSPRWQQGGLGRYRQPTLKDIGIPDATEHTGEPQNPRSGQRHRTRTLS